MNFLRYCWNSFLYGFRQGYKGTAEDGKTIGQTMRDVAQSERDKRAARKRGWDV